MVSFVFSKFALKRFSKLPKSVQDRILAKLQELKSHHDIFSVLKRIYNFEPVTHRLRIGTYRVILELKKQGVKETDFLILDVGHRRDIYRA